MIYEEIDVYLHEMLSATYVRIYQTIHWTRSKWPIILGESLPTYLGRNGSFSIRNYTFPNCIDCLKNEKNISELLA